MRELLKSSLRGLAFIAALPSLVSFWARAPLLGRNRALEGSTQLLALVPGLPGQYVRRAFLARALRHCAPSAAIGFGVVFSQAGARIGNRVYIGPYSQLGLAEIADDVLVASGVQITSGRHTHGESGTPGSIRDQAGAREVVRIGAGTWIGASSVVMADVGRNSIVGAGAVVVSPIPDDVVAAGVPARVIRARISEDHADVLDVLRS